MAPKQDVHLNASVIEPGTDPAWANAAIDAFASIGDSNQASTLFTAGRYREAIEMHKKVLATKVRAHGDESVPVALTYNAMGESYLKMGSLVEAEEVFLKALHVRDDKAFGGLGLGPRNDAAATRDNIGQLREAQGRFEEARNIRLKGVDKGEMMCGSYQVLLTVSLTV